MAHRTQHRVASASARSKDQSVYPALVGALALLATSLILLLLGPQLFTQFSSVVSGLPSFVVRALAAGISLGGAAAMIAVLARLVRDVERHAFASLSAVLAAFSGCVMWGLQVDLGSANVSFKLMGIFGLGLSVAAGAAISSGQRGLRAMGWALSLFAPTVLLAVLWAHSGESELGAALWASGAPARLFATMLTATSLVLALFGEATRGLSVRRSGARQTSRPHRASPQRPAAPAPVAAASPVAAPRPAVATAAMSAAPERPEVAFPAPSLPPGAQPGLRPATDTQRVPHLASAEEADFHSQVRPQGRGLYVAAGFLAMTAAVLGTWIVWESLEDTPRSAAQATAAEKAETSPAAAAAAERDQAPLAPAPKRSQAAAESDAEPGVGAATAAADSSGRGEEAEPAPEGDPVEPVGMAAGPDEDTAAGEPDAAETPPGEDEAREAQPARKAKAARRARARRAQAQRARARRARIARAKAAAARRAKAQRAKRARADEAEREAAAAVAAMEEETQPTEASSQPAPAPAAPVAADPTAKPQPAAAPAAPADDSIDALMENAVRGGGAKSEKKSRADDPIYGL